MTYRNSKYIALLILIFSLNGCSLLIVGENEGFCAGKSENHGYCGDPYVIYKNRHIIQSTDNAELLKKLDKKRGDEEIKNEYDNEQ